MSLVVLYHITLIGLQNGEGWNCQHATAFLGQMNTVLQMSLSAEIMEHSSVCSIHLYSIYLANVYLKAKFPPPQSGIPAQLFYLASAYSVYLTRVLFARM